jgi:hypothetical protein
MNSVTYFRAATPNWGTGAAYAGACSRVVTPAILRLLLYLPLGWDAYRLFGAHKASRHG